MSPDRQLTAMLVADRSPIKKWSDRARESQREEDEQQREALGGSRPDQRAPDPRPCHTTWPPTLALPPPH